MSGKILIGTTAPVPGTPDPGYISFYPKADGNLYWKNDAGTEFTVGTGSGAVTSVNGDVGPAVLLDSDDIPEGVVNFYYTTARFNTDFSSKSTSDLTEGTNLYYTDGRFDTRLATKSTSNLTEGSNLYFLDARAVSAILAASPLSIDITGTAAAVPWSGITGIPAPVTALSGTNSGDITLATVGASPNANGASLSGQVLTLQPANTSFPGVLTAADWNTFNNKLDSSRFNYVTNPDAEVDTSGWNLYNDSPNPAAATVVAQDITYTAVAAGDAGNGINIDYIFHATQSYLTPLVTVVSPTHVTVAWYNGPTLANNPTATQLKAAWDAEPGAVALATAAITGTAGNRQYETGSNITANGGDTSPVDGDGGTPSGGVTFIRSTSSPLVGTASFFLSKDASNREGEGVSTDFIINSLDKGQLLQISFAYSGSAGMVLGSASDVQVFLYDITNNALIPVTPHRYISGPVSTAKTFVGQFTASASSVNYRLILHISTSSAVAWDLQLDQVIINDVLNATAATEVPKLVFDGQPITGAVTDHMAVMWQDGNTAWRPATMVSATDFTTLYGFATNLVGLTADITVRGALDGFSFGPFVGYNQYIDNVTAGTITPLPAAFTDAYVVMGKALSSTTIMVEPKGFNRLITSKGGLLTNGGLNNGTGDVVIAAGTTGQFVRYNTALTNGFGPFTPVATAPMVYTASTSTWSMPAATTLVSGHLTTTDWNTFNNKLTATLASTNIFVGSSGNVATARAMSGDATLGNTGILTLGTNVVTNAKSAQMAAHTFKGNNTGSTADPIDLTIAQMVAELNPTLTSAIINSSAVAGATVTAALNTLNQISQEVYLSATNNGSSTTANTTIATWSETKDTLAAFDPTTGIFTVPNDGDYRVSFSAATTTGTPIAQVYKNGTLIASGVGSGVRTSISTVIPNCVATDTITVALDSSLTLTATTTDTILNIIKETGASSTVVNARRHSATATITGALSNVTYTTSDFDTHSAYSGSTYTIPTGGSGTYRVDATLYITATTVAAGQAQVLAMLKNGTEFARHTIIASAATGKPFNLGIHDLFNFVAGDTLTVQVSSASSVPVMSASTTMNVFSVNKVSN